MITAQPESPLVSFMRAQLPVASRLPDGVRVDPTTLRALLDAHDEWTQTVTLYADNGHHLELSVAEVAALFKRSRSWVYLQMKNGHFADAYEVRGAYRFPKAGLDAFMAAERIVRPIPVSQVAASKGMRGSAMWTEQHSNQPIRARAVGKPLAAADTEGATTATDRPETVCGIDADVEADTIAALPRLEQVPDADASVTVSETEVPSAGVAPKPTRSARSTSGKRAAKRQPAKATASTPASAGKKLSWGSWRAV